MIYNLHCNTCHHEFQGKEGTKCDWCKADSYILSQVEIPSFTKIAEEFFASEEKRKRLN